MRGKSLLSVIGTVLVIGLLAFLVLSDEVVVLNPEKSETKIEQETEEVTNEEVTTSEENADAEVTEETEENEVEEVVTEPASQELEQEATATTTEVTIPAEEASVEATTEAVEETAEEVSEEIKEDVEETEEKVKKPISFKNPLSYKHILLGLDLKGGASILYEADKENPTPDEMASAIALLRRRLDIKGYTEAEVSGEGSKRIRVEIPGMENAEEAIEEIGRTAELKFYGVTKEELNKFEAEVKVQADKMENFNEYQKAYIMNMFLNQKIISEGELVVRGSDVTRANLAFQTDQYTNKSEPVIRLELNSEGKKKFADATKKYNGEYIAIALDQDLLSMPKVNSEITDGIAIISGSGEQEETRALAELINSGSLPFNLTSIQTNVVEARLGQDSLETSIKAGILGLLLVLGYMLIMYRVPGLIANIALVGYAFIIIAILSTFGMTLTLPGIAGIILSIGMAVDANVIIFTRIKEELNLEKTTRAAIASGFNKAMSAIIDGNVTTLIIAAILFWKGTGPIKGFAQTLGIGIMVSMFTALVVTKYLLNNFVNLGIKNPTLYGAKTKKRTVKDLNNK